MVTEFVFGFRNVDFGINNNIIPQSEIHIPKSKNFSALKLLIDFLVHDKKVVIRMDERMGRIRQIETDFFQILLEFRA